MTPIELILTSLLILAVLWGIAAYYGPPPILTRAVLLLQAKNYSGSGDWLDESGNRHDAVVPSGSFNPDGYFTVLADPEEEPRESETESL